MRRILVIAALTLLSSAGLVQAGAQSPVKARVETKAKLLSDAALDGVTAAGITAGLSNNGVVHFEGSTPTPNGVVSSTGSLAIQNAPIGGNTTTNLGSLSLNGNAQQNLSSLVNINAVNSKINVLLNLNININSTVGTLTQSNLNGKP
ncbi:MAG TPA: hypothetical protein VL495_02620 [Edaphobacter sp.]|jgi:hypothetical protein|nr:hypothetical protein [Edaphobacter sp.]